MVYIYMDLYILTQKSWAMLRNHHVPVYIYLASEIFPLTTFELCHLDRYSRPSHEIPLVQEKAADRRVERINTMPSFDVVASPATTASPSEDGILVQWGEG